MEAPHCPTPPLSALKKVKEPTNLEMTSNEILSSKDWFEKWPLLQSPHPPLIEAFTM